MPLRYRPPARFDHEIARSFAKYLRSQRAHTTIMMGFVGVLFMGAISLKLFERLLDNFWFTIYVLLLAALLYFAMGWLGLVMAARQEIKQLLMTIRGKPAIIIGASINLICWGTSLWSLWRIVVFVFWPEQFGPI